jgi:hypothetical protein
MPYTITNPDSPSIDIGSWDSHNYDYDYPGGIDLKPGSSTHSTILGRVMRYGRESARVISQRHRAWEEIDEKLTAYMPTSTLENEIKNKDRRKPVSIVFPYSYAILETLVSYMVAAFFPEPIFRYEGASPSDITGALLLEKVVNLHCNRSKVALNLHTMFRDAGAYGFGAVTPQWTVKKGKKTIKRPLHYADSMGNITQIGWKKEVKEATLFEGNSLLNIDPYRYLPDPAMPLHRVQAGEYVGWMDRTNFMDLLSEEQMDEDLFNVKYLQHVSSKVSSIFGLSTHFNRRTANRYWDISLNRQVSDPVDQVHMYVKLIPKQWGLGKEDVPEKWLFTVAGDSIIIRAKPLNLNHDLFPVALCAPDFDGYSPIAYSRLEILGGMQTVVDWMFNSHVANVRKAINDKLIVDPYLISMKDLESSEPGGFARMRRPAWGKGLIDNAVKQLNVVDITANNMRDVGAVIQYMQQIGGTDNPIMGSLRTGGPDRLTGAEYKGTAQGAVSRLERIAKVIGLQAMQDIGYMFAYHTQQLMEEDVYIKASGDWDETLQRELQVDRGRVKVSPHDILIDYNLLVRDGSIPGGNFSEVMLKMFEIISQNQQLMQQFDVVRIFEWIATNEGAKNIDDFRMKQAPQVQPQVVPDEQAQQQAQLGNLVPMLGGANGNQG